MSIPKQIDFGTTSSSCLSFLWHEYQQWLTQRATAGVQFQDVSDRYACGFPIPSFQRKLVWTEEQKVKFIESLWLGLPPGSFTIHQTQYLTGGKAKKYSGWLIDGQQRLTTIQEYWEDKLRVFGLLYSELSGSEIRRFNAVRFPHAEIGLWNETEIRDLYNRMAFGGVAHKPEETA